MQKPSAGVRLPAPVGTLYSGQVPPRRSHTLEEPRNSETENKESRHGLQARLVTRGIAELRLHPSYVQHEICVSAAQLSALAALGELAFREPIVITRDGTIIDGYARLQLARKQGRKTIFYSMQHGTFADRRSRAGVS